MDVASTALPEDSRPEFQRRYHDLWRRHAAEVDRGKTMALSQASKLLHALDVPPDEAARCVRYVTAEMRQMPVNEAVGNMMLALGRIAEAHGFDLMAEASAAVDRVEAGLDKLNKNQPRNGETP